MGRPKTMAGWPTNAARAASGSLPGAGKTMLDLVLEVTHLGVALDGVRVVNDVSFALERGESLAIIGPNGAGKTMLLRALVGTVRFSGRVRFGPGVKLGYVPQRVEADRFLPICLDDLLRAKLRILGLPASRATAMVELVGLSARTVRKPIGQLSGGHLQKALVAFALLGEPNLILFDEPTASLDRPSEEHIFELIRRLQGQLGLTLAVVSHDLSIVYRYASKVLCLNRQSVCYGPPREVLNPQALERLYGAPHHFYRHDHPT